MPDQTVDNAPKIDKKISPVEKIRSNLQASEQFNQQHREWERSKEAAQENKQDIPEEPKASPEAVRGQLLADTKEKSFTEINNLFEESLREGNKKLSPEKRKENLEISLNKSIDAIEKNTDQELRIMQVTGALDAIDDRIISTKWEEASRLLDISPEALSLSKLATNFETHYIGKIKSFGERFSDLKKNSVQNVLKHLSSEESPLNQDAKEACQLYIEEGKGIIAFDTLFNHEYKGTDAVLTAEQIISAFGLENKVTVNDLDQIGKAFHDQISLAPNTNPNFVVRTLNIDHNFIFSIENVPMILSQLVREKPELTSIVVGKEIGYCKSLLKNRPDIMNQNYDKYGELLYSQLTHKVAESLMNLYDLEKVDFLMEVIQAPAYNTSTFDKEIGRLFLEGGLRIPSINEKTGSQHLKIIEKANTVKRNQEAADLEAKQAVESIQNAEKLALAKKDQEQTVKQFLENKEFRSIISPLVTEKEIFLDDSKLKSINGELDALVENNPNLKSAVEFAKKVALQYMKYTKDGSIATEFRGTAEENYGPFNLLKRNRPTTIFKVDLGKINEIKRQALESNNFLFDPDNQIKVQALSFLSKRNDAHYIEN